MWWEGKDGEVPDELTDWQGRPWKKGSTEKAAHPNCRFTAPMTNNPVLSQARRTTRRACRSSAIIFGGRRATTVPLVLQALQLGARRLPRRDARLGDHRRRRPGKVGVVRRDPMAMLPFCGYNMGDYFAALAGHAGADRRTRPRSSR